MYGIDTPTAVPVQPAQEAAGIDGWATKGSDDGLTPATVIGQDWFNIVSAELKNVVTEGGLVTAKATQTQVRDAIRNMIMGNDSSPVINGSCIFGNLNGGRPNATLTTSFQYAGVDRFAMRASGGAVTGGTISHEATSLLGSSGFAISLLAATLTGAGKVALRYRIESRDCYRYKNAAGGMTIDLNVYHDLGADVPYTITVNKANAQDNFGGGVTQIATSAAPTQVHTITPTRIWLNIPNPGDTTNGLEVIVEATTGAFANKNLRFNELQTRLGSYLKTFQQSRLPAVAIECARYFQRLGIGMSGLCGSANNYRTSVTFGVQMRVAPTATLLLTAVTISVGGGSTSSGSTLSGSNIDQSGSAVIITGFSGLTTGAAVVCTTSNVITYDAEL